MKEEERKILEQTAREYFAAGEEALQKNRFNSAVVLFFKSLISLTDIYLLNELGETPSSHTDRFRKTEKKFPDIYDILDRDFPFYQGSYMHILSKELAEVIKEDAKLMAEKTKVKL